MLSWLSKFCTNDYISEFETHLINCTYSDWSIPSEQSLRCKKLIHHQRCCHPLIINPEKAFRKLKMKFQNHDEKNNPTFKLKNLLIIDRLIQERCILEIICNYEYNKLFYDRNKVQPIEDNLSTQQFISFYYLFIKKKANLYLKLPTQIFQTQKRKSYINNLTNHKKIFQLIDNSLQIQQIINQSYFCIKKINKTPPLLQQILTYILKNYIFVYLIVAISLQTLLSKINVLSYHQLVNLNKLLKYFTKQFTNQFLRFLQINKTITVFKNFQYNEIIKIDLLYINSFQKYFKLKSEQQNFSSNIKDRLRSSNILQQSEIDQKNVKELPEQVFSKLKFDMKFFYQPRKRTEIYASSDQHIYINEFGIYQNYYHENFIQDNLDFGKKSQVLNQNNMNNPESNKKLIKKKSKMQQLVNLKTQRRKSFKEIKRVKIFKESLWLNTKNIYADDIQNEKKEEVIQKNDQIRFL